MKIECLQENLSRGVNSVIKIVGNKNALPVTQNILIKTEAEAIHLTTTNLETTITATVNAKCEELSTFLLPAKLFSEIVNTMHSEKISITQEEKSSIKINAGKTNVKIQILDTNTFPLVKHSNRLDLELDAQSFKDLAENSIYAASRVKAEIMSGVLFKTDKNKFVIVSSNGYRLVENKMEIEPINSATELNFLIPVFNVENLISAINGNGEKLKIGFENNSATFTSGSNIVSMLMLTGIYPKYEPVIPKQYVNNSIVELSSLIHAVKIANLFSNETRTISVITNGNMMLIKSKTSLFGEGMDELVCQPEGGNIEFSANGDFLIEILSKIKDTHVIITNNTPMSPITIRPVNNIENSIHILMPIAKG